MNKRIRKKRRKLRSITVGDHVYTHKEIAMVHKAHIGYMNMRLLYSQIEKPKLTRPRVRSLINFVYKNRMKYSKRFRFKSLFIDDLDELDECTSSKSIMTSHSWRFNIL